jgi:hypothetical protein
MKSKRRILSKQHTHKLLQAYNTITEILFEYIDPREIYKEEFLKSVDKGLQEIKQKKTKRVTTFEEFISG